ncbi:YkuS family protein [Ornithobacterium rhinotracheale]|uniref:YkuS family protein n=1 Tax=Ornithobacterium rhinotracheale TaxID=28251 RepID=UPI001FF28B2D|nr:YkuS family protein [Ornithobacterium rhinotracheale]MCK0201403.1 YkuS family protein [Ornithobacterium rhinotracheale]
MKIKFFLIGIFSIIFCSSCEDSDSSMDFNNENPSLKNFESYYTKEDNDKNIKAMEDYNLSFFGEKKVGVIEMNGRTIDDILNEIKKRMGNQYRRGFNTISITQNPFANGPFYAEAKKVRNFKDIKIFFKGHGFPRGVYIADIYSFPVKVDIPKGVSFVVLDKEEPADHIGYIDYNEQNIGISSSIISKGNGKTQLAANTMAVDIKNNMLGQLIVGGYYPFYSEKITYKYYTITIPGL